MYYYRIALIHALLGYDEAYTYASVNKLPLGARVKVPFGVRNDPREGVILAEATEPDFHVKEVQAVFDLEALTEREIELLLWMHQRYFAGFFQLLRLFIPAVERGSLKPEYQFLRMPENEREKDLVESYLQGDDGAPKVLLEAGVLSERFVYRPQRRPTIKQRIQPKVSLDHLVEALEHWPKRRKIQREILIELIQQETIYKNSRYSEDQLDELFHDGLIYLEDEVVYEKGQQIKANECIEGEIYPHKSLILSHTEVALETLLPTIYKKSLEGTVLILCPTGFLVDDYVELLRQRGLHNSVGITSWISGSTHYDRLKRVKKGDYSVVVGTRNTLFTTAETISLMVVLGAHDDNYRSEEPSLDFIETAIKRASIEGSDLILNATNYPLSLTGKGFQAIDYRRKPPVRLMNLTHEGYDLLGGSGLQLIEESLQAHKRILIYHNLLGLASIISCQQCGEVVRCPECDQVLSYHQEDNHYHCKNCTFKAPFKNRCPFCHSDRLKMMGGGVEKMKALLMDRFNEAEILVVTSKNFQTKAKRDATLRALGSKDYDIIIATRMMSTFTRQGDIDIILMVSPDTVSLSPEYHSAEKSYQMIYTLRENLSEEGILYLQTHHPDHPVYQLGLKDESAFLRRELKLRKEVGWPPYGHLFKVSLASTDSVLARDALMAMKDHLEKKGTHRIFGPKEPTRSRRGDRYHWELLILTEDESTLVPLLHQYRPKGDVYLSIERNPEELF